MESKLPRDFEAFVIMPFNSEFDQFYDSVIVPALDEIGCRTFRADSDLSQGNIIRKIVEGVSGSNVVIADISNLNPNVMYELGLAHGLNRPTIIITNDLSSAPFDLRSYTLVPYTSYYLDIPKLQARLRELVEAIATSPDEYGNPVKDFAIPEVGKLYPSAAGQSVEMQPPAVEPGMAGEAIDIGFLDIEIQIEESMEKISSYWDRLKEIADEFSAGMSDATASLSTLTPRSKANVKQRIVSKVAGVVKTFAKDMGEITPDLRDQWRTLDDSVDHLILILPSGTDEDRETVQSLVNTMENFSLQMQGAKSGVNEARLGLGKMRGASSELNRAINGAEGVLSEITETFEIGEAMASRIVNVLQQRIDVSASESL